MSANTETRAKRCDSAACVIVRRTKNGVEVADSKTPNGRTILYSVVWWPTVLDTIRSGALPTGVTRNDDGSVTWHRRTTNVTLQFDAAEWAAFESEVNAKEHDLFEVTV